MLIFYSLSKLIVALGIFNVWILRSKWATEYRGKDAKTLKEEFLAYGFPIWFFYTIGVLKLSFALLIFLGFWIPEIWVAFAAFGLACLMLGAIFSHIKVNDAIKKMMPAIFMFCLSLFVFLVAI